MAALLLYWEYLTKMDFRFFAGILVYFLIGIILNLLLRKILGYSFHIFFIIFFGLSLAICISITPSPYVRWKTWQTSTKNPQTIRLKDLSNSADYDLHFVKEARTLKEAIFMETFAGKGGDNGARGMVPVIDTNYQPGDSIYTYAAFTSYIGDEGNDQWFLMDKDEDDYAESWEKPVLNVRMVKDTSRILIYSSLLKKTNAKFNLLASSRPRFLELNYPWEDLNYVAHKLTVLGMALLLFAAIVHAMAATKNEKEK